MEPATTINAWMEQLALSILPPPSTKSKQKSQRIVDTFRRRTRHHNFARTNQFDVSDRLDGLEEKFQVLSRDDLSKALYDRRVELREYQQRWIPDVLDLLLRLSDSPEHKTELTDLDDAVPRTEIPHHLKWADIEDGDPFDRRDPIWKIPDFSDLSSDEDEVETDTATTSPTRGKQQEIHAHGQRDAYISSALDTDEATKDLLSLRQLASKPPNTLTDIQLTRHIILMLQGYTTSMFQTQQHQITLNNQVSHPNISNQALQALVGRLYPTRQILDSIKGWLAEPSSVSYIQGIKQMAATVVQDYIVSVCVLEERMLHPRSLQVSSIPGLVLEIEEFAAPLVVLAEYLRRLEDLDPIGSLEALHETLVDCYFVGDMARLGLMLPMFLRAVELYVRPIEAWLESSVLEQATEFSFVYSKSENMSASNLWHDWFNLSTTGPHRPPSFLNEVVQDIFACGKTVAFIRCITKGAKPELEDNHHNPTLQEELQSLNSDLTIPFPAAFSNILKSHFSSKLASRTVTLRNLLETRCGLTRMLDAFEHIYLRKQVTLFDTIESRIFTRIDKCIDNWNDRFVIMDMLEDVFSHTDCIDLESITVQSVHTSSRSMESRRRSVRILGALAIDYTVPWPIANIISKASMTSYRRVALHLLQIRRAKYTLERTAFVHVYSTPISDNPRDQLLAQTTTFMLLNFTNTLYDHFTTSIALPMTTRMRTDLHTARTVDAMIAVHESYIASLEFACLTSTQLKMLRDTLIGLLDMCIRFADLVSTPSSAATRRRGSDEFEAGSFVSARSQRRKKRVGARVVEVGESSSDDDDEEEEEDGLGGDGEGEGYSSFIVLGEDTSVAQEIRKLRVQFKRQLDFFVAGLRGVGRSAVSGTVQEFDMLADRLDWSGK